MNPFIKNVSTTYKLNEEQLKETFAGLLKCKVENISIRASEKVVSSDPMDRYPVVYGFAGLEITVKEAK